MLAGANPPLFRLAFFLLLAAASMAAAPSGYSLSIENEEGAQLYSAPVRDGTVFALRYNHSVALSPVTDYFVVRDNEIWLDKTVYQDFGAGLPHQPGPGQQMTARNGTIVISGFNRKLGSFQLRVGRVANHMLLLLPEKQGGDRHVWQELPLDQLAEPGSAVTFAIRRNAN